MLVGLGLCGGGSGNARVRVCVVALACEAAVVRALAATLAAPLAAADLAPAARVLANRYDSHHFLTNILQSIINSGDELTTIESREELKTSVARDSLKTL
jgi:hypothetical protein